jgi:hypothetical protein
MMTPSVGGTLAKVVGKYGNNMDYNPIAKGSGLVWR